MENLFQKLQSLIKEQKPELLEKLNSETLIKNYYEDKYQLLADLMGEKYVEISKETALKMYYGVENEEFLTNVDYIIANLIFSLQNGRAENVFLTYESKVTIGNEEPEYDYLVDLIEETITK